MPCSSLPLEPWDPVGTAHRMDPPSSPKENGHTMAASCLALRRPSSFGLLSWHAASVEHIQAGHHRGTPGSTMQRATEPNLISTTATTATAAFPAEDEEGGRIRSSNAKPLVPAVLRHHLWSPRAPSLAHPRVRERPSG